jgi:hypothetical protein
MHCCSACRYTMCLLDQVSASERHDHALDAGCACGSGCSLGVCTAAHGCDCCGHHRSGGWQGALSMVWCGACPCQDCAMEACVLSQRMISLCTQVHNQSSTRVSRRLLGGRTRAWTAQKASRFGSACWQQLAPSCACAPPPSAPNSVRQGSDTPKNPFYLHSPRQLVDMYLQLLGRISQLSNLPGQQFCFHLAPRRSQHT